MSSAAGDLAPAADEPRRRRCGGQLPSADQAHRPGCLAAVAVLFRGPLAACVVLVGRAIDPVVFRDPNAYPTDGAENVISLDTTIQAADSATRSSRSLASRTNVDLQLLEHLRQLLIAKLQLLDPALALPEGTLAAPAAATLLSRARLKSDASL